MASCSSLLSEEQFMCSICLDVFNKPVTTPCGHNFCKACITKYWDSIDLCQCPLCKRTFEKRPELFVNTFISEMAAAFEKSVQVKAASSPHQHSAVTDVSCDICTGTMLRALKSCLVCQTSYCETHLEPHRRVSHLIKHKLIDPVENLEDRMCETHNRPLELFCRTDQMFVCWFCTKGDHKTHDTVRLEYGERKAQLWKTAELRHMVQERLEKVQEIKRSVDISKKEKEKEISATVQVFTTLVHSIERRQAGLIQVIEQKQKAAEKQAERFIHELEQEVTELKSRSSELERFSHTEEDHLHFLQRFRSLSVPRHTKNWPQVRVHSGLSIGAMRRTVSQLEDTLTSDIQKLGDAELKRIQQHAVDVTLDPDTANPHLILSKNGKQVRHGDTLRDLPDNPARFDFYTRVLGKQSFSSGRFYYEVQVKGKIAWLLGVASKSIARKGDAGLSAPQNGYWTVWMRGRDDFVARAGPDVPLSLREKIQKVGVFVDYEEGQVSFYNVHSKSHIYSYSGCTFTERLYPLFNPNPNYKGTNSAPMIITPINIQ